MRKKPDWSKPFKFIDTKKTYDEIQAADDTLIVITSDEPQAPPPKHDIIVPAIQTVPRSTRLKSFARVSPNYIRLPPELNLPVAGQYQLTEVDHIFLNSHQGKWLLRGSPVLTADFLRRAIVQLEERAGKDMTLPRSKRWMLAFIERDNKQILQMEGADAFADTVYNYWKNRREELRFPLLRQLWRPNPDEYNHMLAFRPREREKRTLRRTNRHLQDEILEELSDEFQLAFKLVDRVQHREQLKLRQVQYHLTSFYVDCRALLPIPDFLNQPKLEERIFDKERLKNLQSDMEEYKKGNQMQEQQIIQEGVSNIDQKQAIINFLATVIAQAETFGISYDRLFYPSNVFVTEKAKFAQNPIQMPTLPTLPLPLDLPLPADPQVLSEQTLQISLLRHQGLLLREWQGSVETKRHVAPSRDFLEYQRRRVGKFYFGSDDECEQKELRKTIASGFKRYQQMHSFSRTFSAHSQN